MASGVDEWSDALLRPHFLARVGGAFTQYTQDKEGNPETLQGRCAGAATTVTRSARCSRVAREKYVGTPDFLRFFFGERGGLPLFPLGVSTDALQFPWLPPVLLVPCPPVSFALVVAWLFPPCLCMSPFVFSVFLPRVHLSLVLPGSVHHVFCFAPLMSHAGAPTSWSVVLSCVLMLCLLPQPYPLQPASTTQLLLLGPPLTQYLFSCNSSHRVSKALCEDKHFDHSWFATFSSFFTALASRSTAPRHASPLLEPELPSPRYPAKWRQKLRHFCAPE